MLRRFKTEGTVELILELTDIVDYFFVNLDSFCWLAVGRFRQLFIALSSCILVLRSKLSSSRVSWLRGMLRRKKALVLIIFEVRDCSLESFYTSEFVGAI